jgi:hypothetical protein
VRKLPLMKPHHPTARPMQAITGYVCMVTMNREAHLRAHGQTVHTAYLRVPQPHLLHVSLRSRTSHATLRHTAGHAHTRPAS